MNRSTPPSSSASACSLKNCSASSTPVLPQGSTRMPSGPIAPATKNVSSPAQRSRAAARAICAPSRLIAAKLVAQPKRAQLDPIGPERVGLDDIGAGAQVFADARCAPGRDAIRLSDSKQRLMKTPLRRAASPSRRRRRARARRAPRESGGCGMRSTSIAALANRVHGLARHSRGASHANVSASTSRYDRLTRSTQTVGIPRDRSARAR